MNAIEIRGLNKTYEGFKLDNINLDIPTGSIVGLVGENGAGKSTMIKLIMDAIERDGGNVNVLGIDNKDELFTELKNEIGVVLDEAYFPEILNAKDVNLIMKATYNNWNQEKYYDLINKFNLPEARKFKEYSRGMKMKLVISVALSHEAKLLILDEATSGLDPMIRDEVLNVFYEFTREDEHTILLSSHIVSDLEKICDYIAFTHNGKLVFMEEKDKLLEDYAIIKANKEELTDIPEESIISKRENKYSYEVLVHRDQVSDSINKEHITLEDIILFIAKEGM
ncbi:MAG: ABC transporter ATP-binding protein [Peptostreptococcaceae bacterium]|nr:ABC transporter ATP-binding protein [Peptostreptococcaceae bacterium]